MSVRSVVVQAFLAIGMVVVSATSSQAALISLDFKATGDGLITLDDVTGLEWLDLHVATNLGIGFTNFNKVSAMLLPGGQLEGFRYAFEEEISTLWTHAGIHDQISMGLQQASAQSAQIYHLMSLLGPSGGATLGDRGTAQAYGINGTTSGANVHRVSALTFCAACGPNGVDLVSADIFAFGHTDDGVFNSGHWLVRGGAPAPVPEPTTLSLMLCGAAGFLAARRRNATRRGAIGQRESSLNAN